ncbi:MAG TPA: cytochrome c oxidase assembly protein [Gammaproteobacteria bacterium]|nr:cytochrome c oxidase assembly protein [Gammaproteobacteria bacterium]
MTNPEAAGVANRRVLRRLLFLVAGMFGFVFALVPLYNVFCDVTGLNGKTSGEPARVEGMQADTSRAVVVEFVTSVNQSLPWEFRPAVSRMEVHPGKTYKVNFFARNLSDREIVGQAIPSITPGQAAAYFKKTECFCFTEQTLEARQGREMPLIFTVDPGLPGDIKELALAYTFFDKGQKLSKLNP